MHGVGVQIMSDKGGEWMLPHWMRHFRATNPDIQACGNRPCGLLPNAIWNTLPLMVACGAIARIAASNEHGIINLGGRNMLLRDMVNAASGCPKMHNEKGKSKSCLMEVKRANRYIPKHDILAELTRLGKIWRGEV